jgi:putative flippase GtrA
VKKLIRFAIAGGLGFIVDAGILALLLHTTPLGPFLARLIAIALAMATTWAFNRTFTAALVNYGLYAALLLAIPDLQPLAAMVFATGASMFLSFFGYSRFVFRDK